MKNYDERIESVFRKYNERLAVQKHNRAVIRRIVLSSAGLCAAIVLCFAAFRPDTVLFRDDPGRKESLIAGTASSSEADVQTEAAVTGEAATSVSTEAISQSQTDTAAPTTAAATTAKSDSTVTSTETTAVSGTSSSVKTTSRTETRVTTSTSRTETQLTTTVTATTESAISTAANTGNSYTMPTTTTDVCATTGNTSSGEETFIIEFEYGGDTYYWYGGSCDYNGNYFGSTEVIQGDTPVHLDLYRIDGVSEDYAFLVQMNGEAVKYAFVNMDYEPKSLQSYFSDIGLAKYWEISTLSYQEAMPLKTLGGNELIGIFVRLPDTEPVQNISPGNDIAEFYLHGTSYSLPYLELRLTDNGCLTICDHQHLFVFNIGADSMRMIIPDFKG